MSGPRADQPVTLPPHEVNQLMSIYRAHRADVDGKCRICRDGPCGKRASARARLWTGGIDPEDYR